MNRLYRSSDDKILGGVCGGLARYLGVSASLIRILFVLLALANGLGVLTYFALWVLMPVGAPGSETEDTLDPFGQPKEERAPNEATNRAVVGGAVLVAVGLLLLLKNLSVLLWFRWDMVAPLMLIVVGAIVVLNALREES
ncbi:MAG: PspC domain-containing protein [Anaerolineae bacterium]|nr:PspC domain-containing protein [Anaerolineae bacterium]